MPIGNKKYELKTVLTLADINGPMVHDEAQMPLVGVKNSGYGRFGGKM